MKSPDGRRSDTAQSRAPRQRHRRQAEYSADAVFQAGTRKRTYDVAVRADARGPHDLLLVRLAGHQKRGDRLQRIAKSQLAWFCYFCPGSIDSLAEHSSEALKLAEESGDPISMGNSQITYGMSCYAKGHLEDVKYYILEGTHLYGRASMYAWEALGYESLTETYFEMKDYHKAKENYHRGSRSLEGSNSAFLGEVGTTGGDQVWRHAWGGCREPGIFASYSWMKPGQVSRGLDL